jgi:type I restriction enzyme S subunit
MLVPDDVLVNSTGAGTLGRAARWTIAGEATVDSHITIVRFNGDVVDPITAGVALVACESAVEAMAEGSTGQTELPRAKLGALELCLPDRAVQAALGRQISHLDAVENAHRQESHTLTALRDTLLPQLVSGRLRVKDAEEQVEAVV